MHSNNKRLYRIVSFLLAMTLMMSTFVGCGANKNDDTNTEGNTEDNVQEAQKPQREIETVPLNTVMMTIDGKDYTLADAMFVIYSMEERWNIQEEVNIGAEGLDFWTEIYDETTNETGEDIVRKSVMETFQMIEILAPIAEKEGYACTSDQISENEQMTSEILATMDKTYLKRTGFTKENLLESINRYSMVNQYVLDQVAKQKVDEEKAKENIDESEYAQTKLEFIRLETNYMNDEGDIVYKSAEDISAQLDRGNKLLEKVQAGESMSEVYEEEVESNNSDIEYSAEEALFEVDMSEQMKSVLSSLKEGEIASQIVEGTDGYYILRLLENDVKDAYNDQLAQEIDAMKQEAYDASFLKTVEEHDVTFNQGAWDKIVFKNYAYNSQEVESAEESDEATDEDFFDMSELTGGADMVLPDDAAEGDDGSVG